MIRPAEKNDRAMILEVINDAAVVYRTILSDEHWHEPYMSREELDGQIADGVRFYCWCEGDAVQGVMGFQDRGDVQLVRHAYVRTRAQGKGIGGKLITHCMEQSEKPLLVGTWKKAVWAIRFYEKYGFVRVGDKESAGLLQRYWKIPAWHAESSLVLRKIETVC